MKNVVAVLSMLHEGAVRNSATRLFRTRPVLSWTLERLSASARVDSSVILCWEDQFAHVMPIAEKYHASVLAKGNRMAIAPLDAISASRRWADGWRGGLLGTCEFDAGFYAPWVQEICRRMDADAVALIGPSSGLVDPRLLDEMVTHAESHGDLDMCFTQAAPGLAGVVIQGKFIEQLAATQSHAGRLLHYNVGRYGLDPITGPACVPVAAPIARTPHRFTLDSNRQIERINAATISLNGQLLSTAAEELVYRVGNHHGYDALPREIVLEVNVARATKPVFWPGRYLPIDRPAMTTEMARALFAELERADDLRLTLGGMGDGLLVENVFEIIAEARRAGIEAIHVETDLLGVSEQRVAQLAMAEVDVVSVRMPAMLPATYEAVMGVAGLEGVLNNVRIFLEERKRNRRGVPLMVPVFVKCQGNLAEMELWYDQWLAALGSAVIVGPGDYAGQIADTAVADMAPPKRRPCGRLASRMSILCDGKVAVCEQDVLGRQVVGQIGSEPIAEIWKRITGIHGKHVEGSWASQPLCDKCREWHRP